jgi:preprotein translocase subunit SecG
MSILAKITLIIQMIFAVSLIIAILLQQKGGGMGVAFGGSSNVFSTKRGIEKILYRATIVISILFFATSLARLFIK